MNLESIIVSRSQTEILGCVAFQVDSDDNGNADDG